MIVRCSHCAKELFEDKQLYSYRIESFNLCRTCFSDYQQRKSQYPIEPGLYWIRWDKELRIVKVEGVFPFFSVYRYGYPLDSITIRNDVDYQWTKINPPSDKE